MMEFLLSTLLATTIPQPSVVSEPGASALDKIAGQWRIVDTGNGDIVVDCNAAYSIEVSADQRHVLYGEEGTEFFTRYVVLHVETDRALMFIEGEDRKTEQGDPVLWWADFNTANSFRWRQYDWPKDAKTYGEWQRCED